MANPTALRAQPDNAGSASEPIGQDASGDSTPDQANDPPADNVDPGDSAAGEDAIKRIASALEAIAAQEEPEDSNRRADEDLKAQQDMAFWAGLMFYATAVQGAVTLAGLFFIWRTLVHTADQAQAANAAVRVTRETGQAQIASYLIADHAVVSHNDMAVVAEIKIKNIGSTPAMRIKISAQVYPSNVSFPKGTNRHSIPVATKIHDLAPAESGRGVIFVMNFSDPNFFALNTDRAPWVYGVEFTLTWEDVFEREREAWFRMADQAPKEAFPNQSDSVRVVLTSKSIFYEGRAAKGRARDDEKA